MKMLLTFRFCLIAASIAFSGMLFAQSEPTPPNLVIILADDLGYADVGFNGCQDIPTPHIDSIAQEGIRFTNAYVTYAVCGPSRAGLMSGRYPQRFGFERNPLYRPNDLNMGLPQSEETMATVLSKVGYTSGIVGKWHLGAHPDAHPLNRGFDFFFGHLGGGHRYLPEDLTIKNSYKINKESESYLTWILRDHKPVKTTKYLTDEFSDAAVEFVTKNHDKPFFLYLSYNAPHGPLQATEKYLSRFKDIMNEKRRTYAAMVSALDDGVGRVLDTLRENDLDENTLVFFLSDNGGPTDKNASRNTPLRGKKGDFWEGGWRVPFALRWTGQLPEGVDYAKPVSSLDIFATIADLSKAPIAPERPLDGVNLIPYVTHQDNSTPHYAIYLRQFDKGAYAVRRGAHKLIVPGPDKEPLLFDLGWDIREKNNLVISKAEIAHDLEKLRAKWDAQLIEPRFKGLESGRR